MAVAERLFNRFTIAIDIIGHELTHAVTQFTANLVYQGQSGALNESMSDVFGSLVKQRNLGQTAAEADWIIGEGLFTSRVNGNGIRNMKPVSYTHLLKLVAVLTEASTTREGGEQPSP